MDKAHILELAGSLVQCSAHASKQRRNEILGKLVLALRRVPATHRALRATPDEIDRIHEDLIGRLPAPPNWDAPALGAGPHRAKHPAPRAAPPPAALDGRALREQAKKRARSGEPLLPPHEGARAPKPPRRPPRPAGRSARPGAARHSALPAPEPHAPLADGLFSGITRSESGELDDEEFALMLDFSVTLSAASNEGMVGGAPAALGWTPSLDQLTSAPAEDRLDAILRSLDTADMALVL